MGRLNLSGYATVSTWVGCLERLMCTLRCLPQRAALVYFTRARRTGRLRSDFCLSPTA